MLNEYAILKNRAEACINLASCEDVPATAAAAKRYAQLVDLYLRFDARLDGAIAEGEDVSELFSSLETICSNIVDCDSYLFPFFDTKETRRTSWVRLLAHRGGRGAPAVRRLRFMSTLDEKISKGLSNGHTARRRCPHSKVERPCDCLENLKRDLRPLKTFVQESATMPFLDYVVLFEN